MSNYKTMLMRNWLQNQPVQQWYQSKGSKSWEKPIHNRMYEGFKKGYLIREGAANTWDNQRRQLSRECKEMLRQKVKEIEAYNTSNVRAAIKGKKDRSAIARKDKRARCYVCRKRGHVFWKCPNKKSRITIEVPAKDNNSKKPTDMRIEEKLKYPENVHVKTDYMIEGTDFSNWDNIWYVSSAYKKHMSPTKSLFKRLKSRFRMEGTEENEKKFIFSYGIGEAVVETNENEIVIPCVLYTPEVTLNVLSLDQLLAQGFVITYGHNKCRISYMFGEENMVYDGDRDRGKGKECEIDTREMVAKHNKFLEEYFESIDPKDACPLIKGLEELEWDKDMEHDYLDDDYKKEKFLGVVGDDKLVYENWSVLSKRFEDMLKWFYLIYLGRDVLETLPPIIGGVKIDLMGLYKMVDSMGGYLGVSFGNKWKDVALIHGLTKEHDEVLKECYKRTIDLVKCYYETTLRARYKEGLVRYGETEKVERNPQEGVGSSGLQVVKDNTRERFKNIQGRETHFGVTLESDNKTDGNQVTDQRDEGNTSENDDFVVVT
ncbi:ARID DNA-binding domain-containing protein [Tanacetum coccineum]